MSGECSNYDQFRRFKTPRFNAEVKFAMSLSRPPVTEQSQPTKRSTDELFPVHQRSDPHRNRSHRHLQQPKPLWMGKRRRRRRRRRNSCPTITINGKEYQVLRKLGSGGSSTVFLAKQVETGVECALKLVNLEGDPSLVEGYLNETELLAKL